MAKMYRPTHIRQRLTLNGVLIGCTDTSFAMFADATTLGGTILTERDVRNMSDERLPDPSSPGLNLPQLVRVASQLHIRLINRSGLGPDSLRDYLDHNQKVIAQLAYGSIALGYKCQSGSFGHAMLLQTRAKLDSFGGAYGILANDPLCDGPKWYREDDIIGAMRDFAQQSGLATGLRMAVGRRVPMLA